MSSELLDPPRPAARSLTRTGPWLRRLASPQLLWLGPHGLWDLGPASPARRLASGVERSGWHAGFAQWCSAHPGAGCRLLLSAHLLHELLLDGNAEPAGTAARLDQARALLLHYHGEAARNWPLAAWRAAGREGISALHGLSLQALRQTAQDHEVSLQTVRPWWSEALALAVQKAPRLMAERSARLLVVDATLVTQIDLAGGRLAALQQRRLGMPTPQALAALQASLPAVTCSHAMGHGLIADLGQSPASMQQALASLQPLGPMDAQHPQLPLSRPLGALH